MKKQNITFFKKNKLVFSLLTLPIVAIPMFTISCSKDDLSKLRSFLNQDNLVSVEIDIDQFKEKLSIVDSKEILISDIFTVDFDSLKLNKQKIDEWNNNLSDEEKSFLKVSPQIKKVIFPTLNKDQKLDYLDVEVELDSAIIVTKKLRVDLTQINNNLGSNLNNYFEVNEGNQNPNNIVWRSFKESIISKIQDLNITSDKTDEELEQVLDISLTSVQDNLYAAYDSKNSEGIYINIYTNDSKLSKPNVNELKEKCVAIKMFFLFSEIQNIRGRV